MIRHIAQDLRNAYEDKDRTAFEAHLARLVKDYEKKPAQACHLAECQCLKHARETCLHRKEP